MAQSEPRDIWGKMTAVSALVASLLIPIVVVIVGNSFSRAIKESENRVKYLELAIGILRTAPSSETEHLRRWAIEVMDKYSEVPIGEEMKNELKQKPLD